MSTRSSNIAVPDSASVQRGQRDGCDTVLVYSDIQAEYECVRNRVGLQDLAYYGKIVVSGNAALDLINRVILTDLARLPINELQASFMLDDSGRPVADLLIANLGTSYLLMSEGAAPAAVAARLMTEAVNHPGTTVTDCSETMGLLSVDGPYSWELLKAFVGLGIIGTRYREVVPAQSIGGVEVTICRAGKTGEYGYLLLAPSEHMPTLWDTLMQAGEKFSLLPVGTTVADLCKLENRIIGFHHEGSAVSNVFELNTRALFSRDKEGFTGRAALEAVIEQGVARRLVGMTFAEQPAEAASAIAVGAPVLLGDKPIGKLVNAGYSFGLRRPIALALIDDAYACVGMEYDVDAAGSVQPGATVSAPFLFNRSMTLRPQEDSYFS